MKKGVAAGLALLLCLLCFGCAPKVEPVSHYEYPISPDSPDWAASSVHANVEALKIPPEILSRMTDEALVTAIAEYPYLIDLYAYGAVSDGIERTRGYFSALGELLSRGNAAEVLTQYGLPLSQELMKSTEDSDIVAAMAITDLLDALKILKITLDKRNFPCYNSKVARDSRWH